MDTHILTKEEIRDLILENQKNDRIVIQDTEGLFSIYIDDFLKQPVEGILYDLNRLPETILTFIDDPKWINDYAVYLVIKKLYELAFKVD